MPKICNRRGFDIPISGLEVAGNAWHKLWQLLGPEISIQMTTREDGGPESYNHQELDCANNMNG